MNYLKSIIATIPLVMGLAGPSMAAITDTAEAVGLNAEPVSIDSLLNRYTGLVPGDQGSDADHQGHLPSERLSAFTRATSPMSSGYTVMGGDRSIILNANGDGHGVTNGDAAAPAVSAITVAHYVQDTLVSAVSSGIVPSSANSQSPSSTFTPSGGPTPTAPDPTQTILTTTITPAGGTVLTTTITVSDTTPTPVPLPAALILFGSGLAFLAPMRNRLRAKSI